MKRRRSLLARFVLPALALCALATTAEAVGFDGIRLGDTFAEAAQRQQQLFGAGPLQPAALRASGPFLIEATTDLGRCLQEPLCGALDGEYDAWSYATEFFGFKARTALLLVDNRITQIVVELSKPSQAVLAALDALLTALDTRYGERRSAALLWNSAEMSQLQQGYAWHARDGHVLLLAPESEDVALRLILTADEPAGLAPGAEFGPVEALRLR